MKYAIMIYETAEQLAARKSEKAGAYWAAWTAYSEAMKAAGVAAGGAGLQGPDAATTLRVSGDERHVQDGPYADSKEQLGGFFVVDVPGLDQAMDWAARAPVHGGVTEVRPLLVMG